MSRLYVFLLAGALSGCVVTQDWDRFQFGETDAGPMQQDEQDAGGMDAGLDGGCVPSAETCDGTDQDCDGKIDEHPTECSFPNAIAVCEAGQCAMGECEEGFADCDEAAPGCEADLRADRENCGACGVSCGPTEVCRESACAEPGVDALGFVEGGAHLSRLAASTNLTILGGSFGGEAILDSESYTAAGGSDGLLLGADANFESRWGLQIGGTEGTVHVQAMDLDKFNAITIGGQYWNLVAPSGGAEWWPVEGSDEGFVVNVDHNGRIRWTQLYVSAENDQVQDVAADINGKVYVVANTTSPSLRIQDRSGLYGTDVDPARCMVLAKHRASGYVDWVRTFDWCGGPRWLTTGPEGRIAVFGTLVRRWSPAVIGDITLEGPDTYNPVLASFDSSGEPEWARIWRCERSSSGAVRGAVFGPEGDVFIAIECGGETDLGSGPVDGKPGLLMRLDRGGELVWSRPINRAGASRPLRMALGPEGRIYVIGELVGDADFGRGTIPAVSAAKQHFVASFDLDGENRWGLLFGGLGDLTPHDVTVDEAGTVLTSFSFTDTVMIGDGRYTPGDPPATMVVRITEP